MSKPSNPKKKNTLSNPQHARVREQLKGVLEQIKGGQLERAGTVITQLVGKHPGLGEVNHVASSYFAQRKENDRAMYYAMRAVEIDPTVAQYQSVVGALLARAGKHKDAVKYLEQAISLDPKIQQAHSVIGVAYLELGRINDARKAFDRTVELFPDDQEALMNRALLESDIAHAGRAVALMRQAIDLFPDNIMFHDSLAMFSCYDDALSPDEVFAIHREFGRRVQSRVRTPRSYPNTPDSKKKIRIGFVSPDFRFHSIAYFVGSIFEHLNRDRFELFVYATSSKSDEMTDSLKACADQWRVCAKGIAQTHKQIVSDQVDILVELNGHFEGNLLPIFAAKPTPVSATMIGYANTTGLESIDARLVDSISDPAPDADFFASEELVRVPGCFLCYRPPTDAPGFDSIVADRPFTFGSFNDLRKMSPSTLKTWAAILIASPDSRLVLKTSRLGEHEVCDDIHERFEKLGVRWDRIELLGRTATTHDHLSLYHTIDCSLDTYPYTGTTTTCESLWMGVPMITLLGKVHAGRVSASLLTAVGRGDLIAQSEQAYIELATKHAQQGVLSAEARQALRDQVGGSSLTDEPSYVKNVELVFEQLWESWCEKQSKEKGSNT